MRSVQNYHICEKLQKWKNKNLVNKSYVLNNSSNCTHKGINHQIMPQLNKQIIIYPYQKPSFQNQLRKYPKSLDKFIGSVKRNIQIKQTSSKKELHSRKQNIFKRSFQYRLTNYHHIKSRINTNLRKVESTEKLTKKIKLNQDINEKLFVENKEIKSIALNAFNKDTMNMQKRRFVRVNDQNDKLIENTDQNIQIKRQEDLKGRLIYKINLNKKINFKQKTAPLQKISEPIQLQEFVQKNINEIQRHNYLNQNEQISKYQLFKDNFNDQNEFKDSIFLNQTILLQNFSHEYEEEQSNQQGIFGIDGYKIIDFQQKQNVYPCQKDSQSTGITTTTNNENYSDEKYIRLSLVLKNSKSIIQQISNQSQEQNPKRQDETIKQQEQDSLNEQEKSRKFLERQRQQRLMPSDEELQIQQLNVRYKPFSQLPNICLPIYQQLNEQNQSSMNINNQSQQQYNQSVSDKQDENQQDQYDQTLNLKDHILQQKLDIQFKNQLISNQSQEIQFFQNNQSYSYHQVIQPSQPQCQQHVKDQSIQLLKSLQQPLKPQKLLPNQMDFQNQKIQLQKQPLILIPEIQKQNKPKTFKSKQKKYNLNRKRQRIQILTRSQQDQLHLYNKLSLRLLLRKYGANLTCEQLVDKIIGSSMNIQAFIENKNLKQSKISILNSQQLTNDQIKTVLLKYINQQRKFL